MNEWIANYTALPNLHPALVHFPIALVPLAALADLLAALWMTERRALALSATGLWAAAALAAGVTFWAGEQAADSLVGVSPQVHARISEHSDWGLYTLWAVGALAVARLALARWRPTHAGSLALFAVAGVVATGLVFRAADLGGALVYGHGVGVELAIGPRSAAETATSPAASRDGDHGAPRTRLEESADGGLMWRPLPGDGDALGSVLEPLAGSSPIRTVDTLGAAEGLVLEVDGRALLVFSGTYGDVQVDATVDLAGFRGDFGLAHHVASLERAGLLLVSTVDDEVALVTTEAGASRRQLDRVTRAVAPDAAEIAVYAVGRHLRGMLAGETVVHGHEPALPDGRVGLYFDGTGRVAVRRVSVTPISP